MTRLDVDIRISSPVYSQGNEQKNLVDLSNFSDEAESPNSDDFRRVRVIPRGGYKFPMIDVRGDAVDAKSEK